MNIQEIKLAITKLSPDDLARFRKWFEKFESNSKSYKFNQIATLDGRPAQKIERLFERIRSVEGIDGRATQRLIFYKTELQVSLELCFVVQQYRQSTIGASIN